MENNRDLAIKVENVSKDFHLPHEKPGSFKALFTHLFRYLRNRHRFETQHALRNISFELEKGEFFGIVGRNGSGKSTLLKMLAGIYQPNKGKIHISGRLVAFIELGVGFNGELTGRENIYLNGALLGFTRKEIDAQYDEIVAFAELERFMDQKLKNYSSGMQVRLAFSLAIRAEADILLVDEVLAVGDAAFQRKCFEYFKELKAKKKTVVFVTHSMSSVREYCDRAMLIDDSRMKLIGNAGDVAREYALLFMENQATNSSGEKDGRRWGNQAIRIENIAVSLVKNELVVDVSTSVKKKLDKVIYGLHIEGQDGTEITAMNNRMMQVADIENVVPGAKVDFQWKMLNIFNDGKYFVTLTLVDDVGNTLDWFTEAATFTIKRIERSTTAVYPPVSVTSTIKGN